MASGIKLKKIFCVLALLAAVPSTSAQAKGRTKGGSQGYSQKTVQSSQSSSNSYYQREQASHGYDAAYEAPFERQQAGHSYAAQEEPFQQQQMSHTYGAPRGGTSCSERPKGPSNGSMRCQMTSEKNTCTGKCRTGYSFPDGSTIAAVECFLRQGRWIPFKDFPSCTSSYGVGGSVGFDVGGGGGDGFGFGIGAGGGGGDAQHQINQPSHGGGGGVGLDVGGGLGFGGGDVHHQTNQRRGSCERPSFPSNSQMSCSQSSYTMQCQATCNPGYEFPDGSRQLSLSCNFLEGRWMPLPAFQDCRPHCYPECQNDGQCEMNNVCLCPREYRGNRCQYPVAYCDFSRLGSVMVVHDCFNTPEFTECHLSCPPGMTFNPPTPPVYRCTVDGHWNPPITPRCSSDMLCEHPPAPMNGGIQCSGNQDTVLCRATCNNGYTFPEGFLELTSQCTHRTGEWNPMTNFPDCEPVCHPECQHGGRCLGHNRCLCPREYRGSSCQYSVANCDGHSRFSGVAWNCQHAPDETVCQVNCGQTGLVLKPASPTEYLCSPDGTWEPPVKPSCVEGSRYHGGHETEYETQQEEEIGDFGSHTSDRDRTRERLQHEREEQQTEYDRDKFGQQTVDEDENADNFQQIYGQNTIEQEEAETEFEKTDRLIDPRSQPQPRPPEDTTNEEENEIALFPESEEGTAQQTTEIEEESEIEEDKIRGFSVPSQNKGICSVWGYHHYRTFDGLTFTFPGTCDYVLASDCGAGDVTVGLRHRCDSPSSACDIAVEIHVPENRFFITPSGVLRNDEPSPIPVHVGTLTIERISRYIVVKMTTGYIVWMDPDANVHITADNLLLRGKTCGLCGNNDDHPLNDAVSPDSQKLSSPITFGNSWEMPGSEEDCVDASGHLAVCHSDTMEARAAVSMASLLCTSLLDPEYQHCINLLDAEVYFRMCQMDCCSNAVEGCECDTFSQYFMECERLGADLGEGWRRGAICPIQCSNGTEYQQCGPACPPTCSNLQPTCPVENCVDGCHCPSGSVMEDGVCIPLDQCPCRYGTRKYDSGEEMQQDCNTCSCVGGEWKCTDNICSATCSVSGPHFATFDGLNYNLYTSCAHYLVKHRDFSIVVEMTAECYNSPLSVCVKNVIIHGPENAIVKMKPGMEVTVNGQEVPYLPVSAPGVYVTQATSIYMKAQMNNGLEVFWDGGASLYVTVPPELFGKLKGLCGTFSRSQADDFLTPEGDTELTSASFADKWKVDDNCAESYEVLDAVEEEPCERAPRKRIVAVQLCQVLNGPIFSDCHSSVDQEPYYQSCLDDVCRCEMQPEQCLCEALGNYAAACSRKERIISWRREVPECGFHCPIGQVYEECADSCMYSCSVIAGSSDCRKSCVEGCVCPQGQTLDEDLQCVSVSSCSCMHSGHMYPPDFLQRRGKEMCECSYGQWSCRHATASDIILTPPPNIAVHCSDAKNEEFTDCLSECPLTCNNLHHYEPCTVAVCSQGCRCKQGYVWDTQSNTCVLPHECPCHHAGRSYEDGEEVEIDCNTCMCEGGEWKCEDNPCPGLCHAWGESHYLTFDGKIYDFLGDCDYVLVRARAEENDVYSVIIQNVPCGSGGTCSKSLIISLGEWSITLTKEHPLPPVPPESRLTLSQVGMFTLIHSDIGISIQWDQQTRVYVSAEPVWKGKLRGLCGDFDSDSSDDFRPPAGGMPLVRPQDFADTWRVHDYCSPSEHVTDTCETRPERRAWARHKCAVLKSELFQPCHSQVELEPYYSRCIYDACGCDKGGDCQCFCAAVATYAQECARQHVVIPWRSQDLCPVQCEACDRYSPCISLCPPLTCESLTENTESHSCNHEPCVEGCEPKPCKPGYVYKALNNLTCIEEEECEEKPCAVINGVSYREGERIRDQSVGDPCQSCYCRNGEPDCLGVPCTSAATPTPVQVAECYSNGWSDWFDTRDPEDYDGDDYETTEDLVYFANCALEKMKSIECEVRDTQAPPAATNQKIICDLETGFRCEHTADEDCLNYAVRVYCDCVPEVTCPPGEEWNNCAFHCDSTCHSFEKELRSSGVCTEEEEERCVPGCTNTTCEFPYLARDADTCVSPEMCTCRLNSGYLLAPGEVVTSGCEKCQCLNNNLSCSIMQECAPTTPLEIKPVTEISKVEKGRIRVRPVFVMPKTCSEGWTPWINSYDPDSTGEIEDIEDNDRYCGVGGLITAIECRDEDLNREYQLSGLTDVQCNLTGFYCLNSKQIGGRSCPDYKIRLYCDCLSTTETTPTLPVSVPPPGKVPTKRPPPVRPTVFPATVSTTLACSYWSEWINNYKPRKGPGSGEKEDTLPFILKQTEGFCAEGSITDIECRDAKRNRDYKDTKEVKLVCDLHSGFICKNRDQPDGRCLDYKIRYFCECVTPAPPLTTIIVVVSPTAVVPPCKKYRLIIDGPEPLSDSHLKASSSLSAKSGPQNSRLSSTYGLLSEGSWTAKIADDSQFLEVSLGNDNAIYGVVTKGRDNHNEWVTSYFIMYSTDGITYSYYMGEDNMPKVFPGNFDSSSEVRHVFEKSFEARVVRIQPLSWEGHVSLRWDLLGCIYEGEARMLTIFPTVTPTPSVEVCQDPMGLENGLISDSQLSASSTYDSSLSPTNGRLGSDVAWAAAILSDDQYLQIDFMEPRNIAGVVTKGREDVPQWVTSYNVAYSNDGVTWNKIVDDTGDVKNFPANYDQDSVVTNMLPSIVRTRYLRIIPKSWKNWISMQAEILGCFHPYMCKDPMGIESGLVSNGQLSSSSAYDESLEAKNARLDSSSAWAAQALNPDEFLQVDFLETQNLTGVITKGRPDVAQWVTAYKVAYSDDGDTWDKIKDDTDEVQEFMGNSDSDTAVTNLFSDTVRARYIRILPIRWKGWISTRVEVLGCYHPKVCQEPMGLENGLLSDSQLSASSSYDNYLVPQSARLHENTGWVPAISNDDQYLQVDFLEPQNVSAVITKGRGDAPEWVISYKVAHSDDGTEFEDVLDETGEPKVFKGNEDQDTPVVNLLPETIETRFLRIKPVSWKDEIAVRVEVLGCYHPYTCREPMGVESNAISDFQITSSSNYDATLTPNDARLNSDTAWAAEVLDENQYIQVDFITPQNITAVVTQGRNDAMQWVTEYVVAYSDDGETWTPLADEVTGRQKEFVANYDSDSPVANTFPEEITTRFLRIQPTKWKDWISIRFEILGCFHPPACEMPMGLENGLLADSQISVSSVKDSSVQPSDVRLDNENSAWVPETLTDEFVEIDFLEPRNISAVITKGRPDEEQWVTAYKIMHSDDGETWNFLEDDYGSPVVFDGNIDQDTAVINPLKDILDTRYVRIVPIAWNDWIGLRAEILGCYHPYPKEEVITVPEEAVSVTTEKPWESVLPLQFIPTTPGMGPACPNPNDEEISLLTDAFIAASSVAPGSKPSQIFLNTRSSKGLSGGWVPKGNDLHPVLTVMLPEVKFVTGIAIQGREDTDQWVKTFRVIASEDGQAWRPLYDQDGKEEMNGTSDRNSIEGFYFKDPVPAKIVKIIPETWNRRPSLRMDLRGCPHPPAETTPGTTPIPPLVLCPEMEVELITTCPEFCPPGLVCDGKNCVDPVDCVCVHDGKIFMVSDRIEDENCVQCDCALGGRSICSKKSCPVCEEDRKQTLQKNCSCDCEECSDEFRLCRSSGECIPEERWCDGFTDCPDDETDCITTLLPPFEISTAPPEIPENATCEILGRHINTFDDQDLNYDICNHIALQDIVDGSIAASLHKDCSSGNECKHSLKVFHEGHDIEVTSDLDVRFDGHEYTVSQLVLLNKNPSLNITIEKVGEQIVIKSMTKSVTLVYDIRAHLKVGVSPEMMQTIAGLCGFYSGTESDDRRKPDGLQAITTKEFGDSWVVEESPTCEPVICPVEVMTEALDICNQLREEPFTACADVVSVDTFVQFCMVSTCQCLKEGSKPEEKCKCDSFLPLVEACEKEIGQIPLRSWRFKHSCAPDCAPGLTWDDCGPSCQLTCDHLSMDGCSRDCMPGCFCPPGTVLNGEVCVPPDHCSDKVCRGFGDPHLETYDGHFYNFQAEGTFLISSDQNLTFTIEAITEKCSRFNTISCVTGIQVIYNGHRVQMRKNKLVKIDQRRVPMDKLPVVSNGLIVLGFPGRTFVTLIPELSIEVRYYEENSGFAIKIPSQRYFNRTVGLCGNCDARIRDELENNPVSEFVCSWLTDGNEEACVDSFQEPEKTTGPVRICDKLEDEIFSSCHPLVDPDKFIKACSYDASYSGDEVGSFCKTAMEYARQCCQAGEVINDWPQVLGCNVPCPEGLEYVQCHDACPQTCDAEKDISADVNCHSLKVDGCFCPEGTILKDGKCAEAITCETCDSEGHTPGETWNDGPCRTCHCSENLVIDCTVEVCPPNPVCNEDEVLTKNEREEGSCCESFRCVKAPKECPDLEVPTCPEGQVAKIKKTEDLCPSFQCECDPVLCPPVVQPSPRDLEEAEVATFINDTCCPHVEVTCKPELCPEKRSCATGLELTEIPGKCCTIYKCKPPKDVCVYTPKYDVVEGYEVQKDPKESSPATYQPGESWKDGLCANCSCSEVQGQFVPSCVHEQCPSFENVFSDKDYELHEYNAKFKCCPEVFRMYCKDEGGNLYTEGEEWEDPDDPCIKYLCETSFVGDVQKVKKVVDCPACPETSDYIPPSKKLGQCCGICTPSTCDEDGTLYSVGESWVPESDRCQKAECVNVGGSPKVIYTNPSCPSIPDDCPRDKIVPDEKGCCNVCNVTSEIHCSTVPIPLEETVGLFSDYDVSYGGKCINEEPVPDVLICSGACHSESYYSLEDGDFKSVCKCCKVNITVNRTVELRCPDGRLVGKTFLQPENCQCSKCAPESKKPWEKSQQQFQVEQEASWGNSEVEQQPWDVGQFQQEENDYDILD